MVFSIAGIFAVLSYAIQPFLPMIIAVLALLVGVQLIARRRSYRSGTYRYVPAAFVALLAGLSTIWWLPVLTSSSLALVTTIIDWAALIAAALSVTLATWLVLHPLSFLVRGRGKN